VSIFQAIILGIVQGLSEFLPISSSGHLVLVPAMLGWTIPEDQVFPFGVLVQLGTLAAVFIYFRQDIWLMVKGFVNGLREKAPFKEADSRRAWLIILATIPAGVIGLLLADVVEEAFKSAWAAGLFLLLTAIILWVSEHVSRQERVLDDIRWRDAVWIGLGQALAIFPGVSRSGATIASGVVRHINRRDAARFSFVMSIPIMLAAGLLGVRDLLAVEDLAAFLPSMVIGFVTAGVVGYFSIAWLLKFMRERSLKLFSYYCVAFSVVALLVIYVF
jgi:undecaprenyl-diphosphatase